MSEEKKSKFAIIEVNMLGKISENLNSETHCSICRNHLEENSIYSETFNLNKIEKGICNHLFHSECIKRWLTTSIRCPNCFKKWNSM